MTLSSDERKNYLQRIANADWTTESNLVHELITKFGIDGVKLVLEGTRSGYDAVHELEEAPTNCPWRTLRGAVGDNVKTVWASLAAELPATLTMLSERCTHLLTAHNEEG